MARRLKEAEINIVFDHVQFQQIKSQIAELLGDLNVAIERLETATKELKDARKDIDRATARLKEEKRRPVVRNTPL